MPKKTNTQRVMEYTKKHIYRSEADKIKAVAIYMEIPIMERVAEMTGIPVQTLRTWKSEPWWYEVKQKILAEQDEEISSNFTKIVKKAQAAVIDRLDNGDWVVIRDKLGSRMDRKPVSAKDAAYINSTSIDKRQVLNDRPTSRVEHLTMKDKLSQIAYEFEKFSKAKTIEAVPTDETDREVS